MLMKAVESYLETRRATGYKLDDVGRMLRHFARFAMEKGERFIRSETTIDWARMAPSALQRARRLRVVVHLARYLRAEDPRHEVPPASMFVYHVLNRGVGRNRIFSKDADYEAFENVLEETLERRPMRICAYCLMPNHWHLVLWPEGDEPVLFTN